MDLDSLLNDISAQFDELSRRSLVDSSAELAEVERIGVTLDARLAQAVGREISGFITDGCQFTGILVDVGKRWILVESSTAAGSELVLVPTIKLSATWPLGVAAPRQREESWAIRASPHHILRKWEREGARVTVHAGLTRIRGHICGVFRDHIDLIQWTREEGIEVREKGTRVKPALTIATAMIDDIRRLVLRDSA
ncbi:hypothetical protein G7Y41_06650 [Schaalia sp. ZJ405]|uniref:hypothetical protein n=1 Tax=Schaalia sp. ZJ405 TaxID=2709403 RepID=UPI0013EA0673|nr:hypothetical protein [Schaalia sp. ZJ405]QPK80743.1 hypothetical protein G7Y41_06650 [Schaalia sp. ZJ405]